MVLVLLPVAEWLMTDVVEVFLTLLWTTLELPDTLMGALTLATVDDEAASLVAEPVADSDGLALADYQFMQPLTQISSSSKEECTGTTLLCLKTEGSL